MNDIQWLPRLECIAELVDSETMGLADIGYDHAYLLERLAERATLERLIGVEIQADAHTRVHARLSSEISNRLELRHGDGLAPLKPHEVDTVVFAGIGELKILQMLDAEPMVAKNLRRLVVCPANFKGVLRLGLAERGWKCVAENIAKERGHYYPTLVMKRGEARLTHPLDYFGPRLAQHSPRHLEVFLEHLKVRFHAALGAGRGPSTGDAFRDGVRRSFMQTIQQIEPALSELRGRPSP